MWCQLFWCGQYCRFMDSVKNILASSFSKCSWSLCRQYLDFLETCLLKTLLKYFIKLVQIVFADSLQIRILLSWLFVALQSWKVVAFKIWCFSTSSSLLSKLYTMHFLYQTPTLHNNPAKNFDDLKEWKNQRIFASLQLKIDSWPLLRHG